MKTITLNTILKFIKAQFNWGLFPCSRTISKSLQMKTITLNTILEFIKAQKDDRKVCMIQGTYLDEIGCILNHYCKSKGIKFTSCDYTVASNKNEIVLEVVHNDRTYIATGAILKLFNGKLDYFKVMTYGELKTYLN